MYRGFCTHTYLGSLYSYRVCSSLNQIHHRLSSSSCSGVWDPWSCRIPILLFEKHCSTEAMIGILPMFAQYLFLLDTEVFVWNLLWYPKVPCIFVFSLMYCFQLIHRMILCLQHSMLSRPESTLQISNGGF